MIQKHWMPVPYTVLHREVFYCRTDLGGTPSHTSPQLIALLDLSSGHTNQLASFSPCLGLYHTLPLQAPPSLSSLDLSLCPGLSNFKV